MFETQHLFDSKFAGWFNAMGKNESPKAYQTVDKEGLAINDYFQGKVPII